jgi:photosystem II stability/assembly factor-like uncharacterized protein
MPLYESRRILVLPAWLLFSQRLMPTSGKPQNDDYAYVTSTTEVSDIQFVDSLCGWTVIQDHDRNTSHLLRTVDGGSSWLDSEAPAGLFQVYFSSSQLGWGRAVANRDTMPNDHILRTASGGENWQLLSSGAIAEANRDGFGIVAMAFSDSQHGWLVGSGGFGKTTVLETPDGGDTFQKASFSGSIANAFGIVAR